MLAWSKVALFNELGLQKGVGLEVWHLFREACMRKPQLRSACPSDAVRIGADGSLNNAGLDHTSVCCTDWNIDRRWRMPARARRWADNPGKCQDCHALPGAVRSDAPRPQTCRLAHYSALLQVLAPFVSPEEAVAWALACRARRAFLPRASWRMWWIASKNMPRNIARGPA